MGGDGTVERDQDSERWYACATEVSWSPGSPGLQRDAQPALYLDRISSTLPRPHKTLILGGDPNSARKRRPCLPRLTHALSLFLQPPRTQALGPPKLQVASDKRIRQLVDTFCPFGVAGRAAWRLLRPKCTCCLEPDAAQLPRKGEQFPWQLKLQRQLLGSAPADPLVGHHVCCCHLPPPTGVAQPE